MAGKPVAAWSPAERVEVEARIRSVLRRVGRPETDVVSFGELTMQVRRRVSASELEVVGPAIDVRSRR